MSIGIAITGAAAKTAFGWIGGQLSSWQAARKASQADDVEWGRISQLVLKHTKGLAERYSKIKTVAFPREAVLIDSIYVPLTLSAQREAVRFQVNKFPSELINQFGKILIVDVAGMGKSTISRIIFLTALREMAYLPILVDLRRLDGSEEVEVSLANQFGLRPKQLDLFSEFLTTQPLLFIFDGFDEVGEKNKLNVARLVRKFVDRSEKASFIITSRPELPFSDYTDFELFSIAELTKDEAQLLIEKYGEAYAIEDRAKALLAELKARHDGPVESFLKNPLLTSLLFQAFEYKSVIPVKRGVFYRQVFDALYETHDLNKETGYVREKRTGLHHDDFHRAVRAMAKLFREKSVVEVSVPEFLLMAKSVSGSMCPDLNFAPDELLHDVVHAVPVFVKDGNFVRWAHKSLLDYFLSEFLLRDYSDSKDDALRGSAFGPAARANENFLVLAYEADPILFANAVTLPAIDQLLDRYDAVVSALPKNLDENMAADAATFFMNYDVSYTRSAIDSHISFEHLERLVGCQDCFPVLLYQFASPMGALLISMHHAAGALSVPMILNSFPYRVSHDIARNYERVSPASEAVGDLVERTTFLNSRRKKADWDTFEDEFSTLMGLLQNSELRLAVPSQLAEKKEELSALVSRSIRARSNKTF